MYTAHYNLKDRPFQLSPDHRFFFGSRSHKKAMAYLTYGLSEKEGFIVITGDIGAGKTTMVRHLLSQIDTEKFVSATVVTTHLEADDALRMVASAFNLPIEGADKATLLRSIERFLTENHTAGKHTLLIVDEVQNMPVSALEELRMLSNYQVNNRPLLQCFLLGQPQFRRIMAYEDMEQLRQRVIASCHLEPLTETETREYIEHRLRTVGWDNDPTFSAGAFRLIHSNTNGVPRRINTLCSRLLLFGYLEGTHHIDERIVNEVVQELAEEGRQLMPEEGSISDAELGPTPSAYRHAPPPYPPAQAAPVYPSGAGWPAPDGSGRPGPYPAYAQPPHGGYGHPYPAPPYPPPPGYYGAPPGPAEPPPAAPPPPAARPPAPAARPAPPPVSRPAPPPQARPAPPPQHPPAQGGGAQVERLVPQTARRPPAEDDETIGYHESLDSLARRVAALKGQR